MRATLAVHLHVPVRSKFNKVTLPYRRFARVTKQLWLMNHTRVESLQAIGVHKGFGGTGSTYRDQSWHDSMTEKFCSTHLENIKILYFIFRGRKISMHIHC